MDREILRCAQDDKPGVLSSFAALRISGAFVQQTSLTWPGGLLGKHQLNSVAFS